MTSDFQDRPGQIWGLLLAAWVVSVFSTFGALLIGEVMGQSPCVLCWYQRIFMFPLAIVLGIGCYRSDAGVWRYALPLAVFGGLIALYHSGLYANIIPTPIEPCEQNGPSCTDEGMTLFGVVPIPFLSLGAFLTIALLLILAQRRSMS